eukprot:CAMPEP_0114351976 /NCGR_PEP_ID=MMETSP0101-20121206/17602_1 /TAXON_ID=38822 ORGANISM="Pteridomonas danica, Strain PT" /NCGR_SAMPLE_ID=MMETSP0101 /ASSEMBLY_ACC=CAM_ASM_000211 /LENGTH=206 /DNA_ID=CAMNT_0001492151 /DNA_START=539 /DNA_END=1156 /DNA_ORIENTATION=+
MARHSGFPAQIKYDGVPFTLRQPFATTTNDTEVFSSNSTSKRESIAYLGTGFPNDAMMAVSLPKQLLDSLPGYEDDPALCRISCEVLSSLRPPYLSTVVDPKPWLEGFLLLSPGCIVRSYSLSSDANGSTNSSTNSSFSSSSSSSFSMNSSGKRIISNGRGAADELVMGNPMMIGDKRNSKEDYEKEWVKEQRPKIINLTKSDVVT